MVIDAHGTILAQAGTTEEIVFHEIGQIFYRTKYVRSKQNDENTNLFTVCYFTDIEDAERMRKALPTRKVRRVDIYKKYHEK